VSPDSRILVAGGTGLLGSALLRRLAAQGYKNIASPSRSILDLANRDAVASFFSREKPEYVFLAAGKVGGIVINKTRPAEFMHVNLAIQDNVFEAATAAEAKQVIFYGSSCTYPRLCEQPMHEDHWMTGPIEETSEAYAAAKIAGIIACRAYNIQYGVNRFRALVPNSIYGPNDCFDTENAHVLSALLAKFHKAATDGGTTVELWGTGAPRREFIFSDDVADASIFAATNPACFENRHYNVGAGVDISIRELAEKIAALTGFAGEIAWDSAKPDGAPRKLLDSSRFTSLGWLPKTTLDDGLKITYEWFKRSLAGQETP
jgi:GDP-L-fucose synthase